MIDPGVGAVEIQFIVGGAGEDVVEELDDGLVGAVAAGEIEHVVVVARDAVGDAEEIAQEEAPPTALDAAGAVQQLEIDPGCRRGKDAIADQKRGPVQMQVGRTGVGKSEMVAIDRAGGHLEAGGRGAVGVEGEIGIGETCLRGADGAINGDIAPIPAAARAGEKDVVGGVAFGQQSPSVGHRQRKTRVELERHAGLQGQSSPVGDGDAADDGIRAVRGPESRVGRDRSARRTCR